MMTDFNLPKRSSDSVGYTITEFQRKQKLTKNVPVSISEYPITKTPEEFRKGCEAIQRVADNFAEVERRRENKLKWPSFNLSEAIEVYGQKIQEAIASIRNRK